MRAGLRKTGLALGAVVLTGALTSASADAMVAGGNAVQPQVTAAGGFTPGDVVVYRVGDGSAALSKTVAAPVFLDEYSPAGNLIESVALPTATSGANKPLVATGTAGSEGLLTLSGNGQCLLATGYDTGLGGTSAPSGASSSAVPRTVAVVNASATVDTSTALTDDNSGNNVRSASSNDCTNLYVGGAASGVEYATDGASTGTFLNTSDTNVREVQVVDGQLYTSGDPTKVGALTIAKVGTGLPTTGSQTIANLNFNSAPAEPYGYAFLTLGSTSTSNGPDTLYVADNSAGAILKYSLVGGTWTRTGSAALTGVTGVTANDASGTVTIYATTAGGIYSLTDTSGAGGTLSGTPSMVATAAANTSLAGVAFAPGTTIGAGPAPAPPASTPTITATYSSLPAAEDAAGNPSDPITVGDSSSSVAASSVSLSVTSSSNTTVAPLSAISLTHGAGGNWTLSVTPPAVSVGAGTSTITLTAMDSNGGTSTQTVSYDVSAPQAGLTGETGSPTYYDGVGNASSEIPVGGGYFISGDDEVNQLHLYKQGDNSEPLATYDFTSLLPYGSTTIDIEAAAEATETVNGVSTPVIYWFGSESNSSSGNLRPATFTVFATAVSGSGASTALTYLGSYSGLRTDTVNWDINNGNPLGLNTASQSSTTAKSTAGYNIEGAEFAPGSNSTVYLAFRSPLEPYANDSSSQDTGASSQDALLVPVTNLPSLIQSSNTTSTTGLATFGSPIELNLGGLGFREIRKNANDQYLIVAGTSGGSNSAAALYAWDGQPGDPAVRTRTTLPTAPAGDWAWEGIVQTPALTDGSEVELVQDDGDYAWYGNGLSTKSTPELDAPAKKDLGANFTLELATQAISFSSTTPNTAAVGGAYTPAASASSGLPVTYSVDSSSTNGACTITSGQVSFTGPGACVIDANQAGDYGYDAAPQAQQSFSIAAAPTSPSALISEFRPVGPSGATGDDYVDVANLTSAALSTTGWTLTFVNASGVTSSVSLGGTIPVAGHLLAADSTAYSLAGVAAADVSYTLPSGFGTPVGVKLLDASGNLVDAVGFAGAPAGYSEGTPLTTPATYPTGEFSFTRKYSDGLLANTESNRADFNLLALSGDGGSSIGTPGPLNLASPVVHNDILQSSLADPNASASASPNFVYAGGTVDINRTLTNCSGLTAAPTTGPCVNALVGTPAQTVTRLQFRVTSLTTGVLLAEASPGGSFTDANNTAYPVQGLVLAAPATGTTGLNAVLVGTSDLPTGGLAPEQSINVEFQFAVVGSGSYVFAYNAEDDLEAYTAPASTPSGAGTDTGQSTNQSPASVAASPTGVDATPISSTTSGAVSGASATAAVTPASVATQAKPTVSRKVVKKKATKKKVVKKKVVKKKVIKKKVTKQRVTKRHVASPKATKKHATKQHKVSKPAGTQTTE